MVRLTWAARVLVQRLNILSFCLSHSRSHMQSQIGSVFSATCNRFIVDSRMKIESLIFFSFFIFTLPNWLCCYILDESSCFFLLHILKNQHTSQTSLFVVFKWEKKEKTYFCNYKCTQNTYQDLIDLRAARLECNFANCKTLLLFNTTNYFGERKTREKSKLHRKRNICYFVKHTICTPPQTSSSIDRTSPTRVTSVTMTDG